jgi:general secretion pathway protein D
MFISWIWRYALDYFRLRGFALAGVLAAQFSLSVAVSGQENLSPPSTGLRLRREAQPAPEYGPAPPPRLTPVQFAQEPLPGELPPATTVEEIPAPQGDSSRRLLNFRAPRLMERADPPLELVEFRETPLTEAAKLLSDQSGIKIVPSAEAGKVLVSLYLRDVRPGVAIDALTKAHNLFYREDPETGIVQIYSTKEYERDLGSFREEQTRVFTLLYPNPVEVAYAISGAFGERVQLTVQGQTVDNETLQDLSQRFGRFNLVDQQARVLGGLSSGFGAVGGNSFGGFGGGGFGGGGFGGGSGGFGGGSGGFGGGSGGFGGGGGGLGGIGGLGGVGGIGAAGGFAGQFANGRTDGQSDPGEAPKKLEGLTAEQIQKLEQGGVAIDELLRARKADIFVSAVPRNNQLIIRTADTKTMERIGELIAELDVPTPLVLLEVQVLALQLGDDFRSAFDYQFSDGKSVAGGFINNVDSFTTGNILPPAADAGGLNRFEPLAPGPVGSAPNQNMTFQVVSSNFRFRLQALESKNRVTQLATPLLLTANNEVSRIFIGRTIPVTLGFSGGTNVANQLGNVVVSPPVPITVPQNIGQTLLITPNINADRTVTLRVAQEMSALDGTTNVPVPFGDQVVDQPVDVVRRTTVTGTLVAKDGLTVAIGGLIQEDLMDSRQQIPVLGKLPVIGIAFRGQQTERMRTELVVMIRPYVFNTPHESAALSHELVGALSIHPHAPDAVGTMNSFLPREALRANPPQNQLQTIFRFHSLVPKAY